MGGRVNFCTSRNLHIEKRVNFSFSFFKLRKKYKGKDEKFERWDPPGKSDDKISQISLLEKLLDLLRRMLMWSSLTSQSIKYSYLCKCYII